MSILLLSLLQACGPLMTNKEQSLKLADVEKELAAEQTRRQEGEKDNAELQLRLDELNDEVEACKTVNENLSSNLLKVSEHSQKLNAELERQKSVLKLQEQVIQLLDDTKNTIESSLKDQIAAQEIEIQESEDQLKVILVDKILFDSGSVELKEEGGNLLLTLAETFRKNKTHEIVVQGYADNVPLSEGLRERFPTNWELSAARAASVVRFLQDKGGLDPEKLSLKAYGSYRPVASNDTEAGKAQNRRIEIILDAPG